MITIENKYGIGQKVYFLDNKKKCKSMTVTSVAAYVSEKRISLYYSGKEHASPMGEDELFESPADMQQEIFGDLIEFV